MEQPRFEDIWLIFYSQISSFYICRSRFAIFNWFLTECRCIKRKFTASWNRQLRLTKYRYLTIPEYVFYISFIFTRTRELLPLSFSPQRRWDMSFCGVTRWGIKIYTSFIQEFMSYHLCELQHQNLILKLCKS